MLLFLKTYWRSIFAGFLLLVSLAIWNSNSKEEKERHFIDRTVVTVTAPFEGLISWVADGVRGVWYGYFWYVGLRDSHDQLLKENDQMRGELALLAETTSENERLRGMLDFRRDMPGEMVAASVIGSDSASYAKSLRINRGSRAGITRNMAVVTPSGVVGRVLEVAPWHADVQLVTDPHSRVPVRVQRTRSQGMLEGLSKGLCHLKYVARSEDVQPGDVVVTSGLGGIFPGGLVVGTVVNVEKREFGVLQDVRVTPAVDLQRLPEEVFVVLKVPEADATAGKPVASPTQTSVAGQGPH